MIKKRLVLRAPKRNRAIRIVRRRTERKFRVLYDEYKPIIAEAANSRMGYVPGLDREDVRSYMAYALWVAFKKWEGKGEFHMFWWTIWRNQRAELIRTHNRIKRPATTPAMWDELIAMSPVAFPYYFFDVSAPPVIHPTENQLTVGYVESEQPVVPNKQQEVAWALLALGYTASEVRSMLQMGWRDWYAMIELWRCAAVEWMLKEDT